MIFTDTLKTVVAGVAMLWLAGCSFVPQQPGSTKAAVNADTAVAAAADSDAPEADEHARVFSVNPYTEGRKSVPGAAQKRFLMAIDGMRAGDWQSAEEHLVWLNNEYPKYSGPFLNLGIVYEQQGKLVEAETAYLAAIEANYRNLDAYNQLAVLLREQGRFEDAEARYQQAIAVWPEHPESHRNLGILYDLYMGRLEQALAHYQQYRSVSPDPDRSVTGWIVDLERRLNQVAVN